MEASQANMSPTIRVLMLPWLAHGHISPFLELAKKLCANNFAVYLCSTSANLASVEKKLDFNAFPHLHLTELRLPDGEELPPHLHTTKNLPSHLMPALKTAFDRSAASFSRILDSLSPHLVIYDFLQPWAPLIAAQRRIPAVLFFPIGAASASFYSHCLMRPPDNQFPFPALHFAGKKLSERTALLNVNSNDISDGDRFLQCMSHSVGFVAMRTCREIEAKYIDHLSFLLRKEVVLAGPLLTSAGNGGEEVEWLSGKQPGTVVFVSVGSEYFMTEKEVEEMAQGLELSGLCFIWVVRLEGGHRRRVSGISGDKGLLVEGWAAQKEILAHPSVGGFVTHCGWSSVMEGIQQGVPMVALPLQLDQPLNAELLVELGIGVRIKEEGFCRFRGEEVARCIREVMVGEEGEGVRRRAKEMSRIVCSKGDEEMKGLVERIQLLAMAAEKEKGAAVCRHHEAGNASAVEV